MFRSSKSIIKKNKIKRLVNKALCITVPTQYIRWYINLWSETLLSTIHTPPRFVFVLPLTKKDSHQSSAHINRVSEPKTLLELFFLEVSGSCFSVREVRYYRYIISNKLLPFVTKIYELGFSCRAWGKTSHGLGLGYIYIHGENITLAWQLFLGWWYSICLRLPSPLNETGLRCRETLDHTQGINIFCKAIVFFFLSLEDALICWTKTRMFRLPKSW